jgi:hypothetical protein
LSQLSREADVDLKGKRVNRRALLDAKLTELMLFAKELYPCARVKGSTIQYEDEDGRVDVFAPPGLSEAEEDRLELTLAGWAADIFDGTGLYIVCAVLDPTAR